MQLNITFNSLLRTPILTIRYSTIITIDYILFETKQCFPVNNFAAGENSCNWSITVPILPFLHHERTLDMILADDMAFCVAPLIYLLQPWPLRASLWRERSTSWLWLNGSGSAAADEQSQKILQAICGSHLPAVPQGKWLTALLPHRVISKDWLHPVCTQALYPTCPSGLLCHVVTDHADVQADSGRTMPAVNPRSAFVLKRRWYRYNKLSVLWFVVYFSLAGVYQLVNITVMPAIHCLHSAYLLYPTVLLYFRRTSIYTYKCFFSQQPKKQGFS